MDMRLWVAICIIAAIAVACAPSTSRADVTAPAAQGPAADTPVETVPQVSAQTSPTAPVATTETAPPEESAAQEVVAGPTPVNETAPATAPEIMEVRIEAYEWGFEPSQITIPYGTRVRLLATSREGEHGISIPDLDIRTGTFGPGETKMVEFTADTKGTFRFRCNVSCGSGHSDMTGTITVV